MISPVYVEPTVSRLPSAVIAKSSRLQEQPTDSRLYNGRLYKRAAYNRDAASSMSALPQAALKLLRAVSASAALPCA